jgi:hypothetical protein
LTYMYGLMIGDLYPAQARGAGLCKGDAWCLLDLGKYGFLNVATIGYFVLMNLIIFHIIFGVIVDSFRQLKERSVEKQEKWANECFVCNCTKKQFVDAGKDFGFHHDADHNLWKYVYFIYYIRNMDKTELTGEEGVIDSLLDRKNMDWMPKNRTIYMKASMKDFTEEALNELYSKGNLEMISSVHK